jgi:hypothetical protein
MLSKVAVIRIKPKADEAELLAALEEAIRLPARSIEIYWR